MTSDRSTDGTTTLSRRAVLSSLATVGGVAGLAGAGTTALPSDAEGVTVAKRADHTDLKLCWQSGATPCTPTGDSRVSVVIDGLRRPGDGGRGLLRVDTAGDRDVTRWLRTDCPTDACGIERQVRMAVRYDDGGTPGPLIHPDADGSICSVTRALAGGVELADPPSGSGPVSLWVSWELRQPLCGPDATVVGFELAATQDHRGTPTDPWPGSRVCATDCSTGGCPDCVDTPAVEWLGIGSDGVLAAGDVHLSVRARNRGGDPARVAWSISGGAPPVTRVLLAAGGRVEVFPGGRDGVVQPGHGTSRPGNRWGGVATGLVFEPVGGGWRTDQRTLAVADPSTPGSTADHTVTVSLERAADPGRFWVRYPPGFRTDGVDPSAVVLSVDGTPLDPAGTTVGVAWRTVTVALAPAARTVGSSFELLVPGVRNPDIPGSYPLTCEAGQTTVTGRVPIRNP